MNTNAAFLAAEWLRLKERLLSDYPELAEDGEALRDTLSGEADALDAIAGMIRAARRDEAMADALASMIADERDRKSRLEHRAEKRLEVALSLMNAIGERKVEMPDFTASIRAVPPKVEIFNEAMIPRSFGKSEWKPDKRAIGAELIAGHDVPGAVLTNGGETLSRRFK